MTLHAGRRPRLDAPLHRAGALRLLALLFAAGLGAAACAGCEPLRCPVDGAGGSDGQDAGRGGRVEEFESCDALYEEWRRAGAGRRADLEACLEEQCGAIVRVGG